MKHTPLSEASSDDLRSSQLIITAKNSRSSTHFPGGENPPLSRTMRETFSEIHHPPNEKKNIMKNSTPVSIDGAPRRRLHIVASNLLPALLLLFTLPSLQAGSATWKLNPTSNNWNTAANWTGNTVPNGTADVATFGVSNTADVALSASAEVNSIVFNPGANPFTIAPQPGSTLTISGAGVINNSGSTQNLAATFAPQGPNGLLGIIAFTGASSAGAQTVITSRGGSVAGFGGSVTGFNDTATAGNATIINQGGTAEGAGGGVTSFSGNSSAGNGTFINSNDAVDGALGGHVTLRDNSTAANGTFIDESRGGNIVFFGSATAGNATFLCKGSTVSGSYSQIQLVESSSADQATFTFEGGEASGAPGASGVIGGIATGSQATFIVNGGSVSGALGATFYVQSASFGDRPTAGNATLIANGGVNGGEGGTIAFTDSSTTPPRGGTSRVEVFGNGSLDISPRYAHPLSIGSLEGDGRVFLGAANLSVGNRMGTLFSGIIQDGGVGGGTGGSLTKIGSETFQTQWRQYLHG